MEKLVKVKVSGLVQGVFFRHSAKMKADELGLKGFARNEDGGSVYIEAAGEEADLNEFLDWCRQGPPSAKVDNVEYSFSAEISDFSGFDIK